MFAASSGPELVSIYLYVTEPNDVNHPLLKKNNIQKVFNGCNIYMQVMNTIMSLSSMRVLADTPLHRCARYVYVMMLS